MLDVVCVSDMMTPVLAFGFQLSAISSQRLPTATYLSARSQSWRAPLPRSRRGSSRRLVVLAPTCSCTRTYTGEKSKGVYVSRLDMASGALIRSGTGGRDSQSQLPCGSPDPQFPVCGERGRDVRGQGQWVGQRLRHRPGHRQARRAQSGVLRRARSGLSGRGQNGPERGRLELWRGASRSCRSARTAG